METMETIWTGEDVKARQYLSRRRTRAVDRRTRRYKLWVQRRERLVAALGRTPNVAEVELIDLLCDRLIDQDIRRAERSEGIVHSERDIQSAISEIRRMMRELGLLGNKGDETDVDLSHLLNGKPSR